MPNLKLTAEHFIHTFLRVRNVPESQWPDLIKKTGRGMILTGVFVDNISLPLTVVMQICYALLIGLGVLLAFDDKKSKGGGKMRSVQFINLSKII